jgi:membrane protein
VSNNNKNGFIIFFKDLYTGFIEHRLLENASSLSYYTLMSLVPILAVLFGIAKGFGIDPIFEQEVLGAVPNQQELAQHVIDFSRRLLEESRGGLIAGVGVLLLLWSFLGLLGNFEKVINEIWHIHERRSYSRRIGDFLGFIFLCPFFFVIVSSVTLFLSNELIQFFQARWLTEVAGPYLSLIFQLIPVLLSFFVFSFFYLYLPNIPVPWMTTLSAALITSLLFHLAQWGYVHFQIGIARYGAVYGSFAAIPLFLIWLQLSWHITLHGAELSYRFSKIKAN